MVVDIMEFQVQSQINFFILFFLISSCNHKKKIFINYENELLNIYTRPALYNKSLLTGKVVRFYTNSNDTLSITNYKNGFKNGRMIQKYKNGKLMEERYYTQGKKSGRYIGYYKNGKKKFEKFFLNDEFHGKSLVWNINGDLLEKFNYRNGYEHGSQKVWYPNGKIKSNYIVKNNRRYGLLGTKKCVSSAKEIPVY